MNKKYGIVGLILIVILTTVMVSGCIGYDSDKFNREFTNAVNFQGVTFYLPDGFKLSNDLDKSNQTGIVVGTASDGEYIIELNYFPKASMSDYLATVKSPSRLSYTGQISVKYSNINESVTIGGYSGFTADYTERSDMKMFVFEKEGKTFAICLSQRLIDDGFNFNEIVAKIIG